MMENGRITKNLNLHWKFLRGDEPKAWYKGFEDINWRDVTLPHDWSVEKPFSIEYSSGTGYLPGGTGWYRKKFTLPEELKGKRVYITFEGVYNNSQVWCNSYYIGKRPYGYSTFTYDITDFAVFGTNENVISVKVDHKDIADSRWFTGSGIYRNVYLTITGSLHIDKYGVFVTMPEVSCEKAIMNVNAKLLNEANDGTEIVIRNTLLDHNKAAVAAAESVRVIPGDSKTSMDQTIDVSKPMLWSPDTPYLYTLLTEVVKDGQIIDHVNTPVGLRRFEFDADKGFSLNGSNMKIKGVCIHHDAGCLGAAVPEKVWRKRLEALKEMGCNAIRMSHNPPAPNLLDLCDSMGFLVIDEAFDEWEGVKNKWSSGHNVYPPRHFGYYEDFPQWSEIDIKEMVLRDRNHPSIISWSIGNEVDYPNDPYCHPLFETMTGNNDANKPEAERKFDSNKPNAERLATIAKQLVKYVKECDSTRPVTAALAFPELSNLIGYAEALDIVGYNYKEHLYNEDHVKYPGRIIYGSENSASLEAWLAVKENDYMSAQFIWTGIDFLGEAKGWPVRVSQAGFLDLAGFKKPKYFYRQSLWSMKSMVYLSARIKDDPSNNDYHRLHNGDVHWNWMPGEKLEVICYTNCEETELTLNGKSLGIKKLEDSPLYYLSWEVEFEEGVLKAEAKNKTGEICTRELCTVGKPAKLEMNTEDADIAADGQDISIVEIQVLDAAGNHVYMADNEIYMTIEGPGEIIGMENGDARELEPYSSKKRKAYHGRLAVYVRGGTIPGEILLKAEAQGLEPARTIIMVR